MVEASALRKHLLQHQSGTWSEHSMFQLYTFVFLGQIQVVEFLLYDSIAAVWVHPNEPPVRFPLLLTLQVKTQTQPEKKTISTPLRQPPTTPASVAKSISTPQQDAKAKVALWSLSLLLLNKPGLHLLTIFNNQEQLDSRHA